ncbi:MAG: coproporphyrinogen III oxidase, partial [Rubripirellula sp.]
PLGRGFVPSPHQKLVREMILLLKRGYLDVGYFREKFGVDIRETFSEQWQGYVSDGYVKLNGDAIELTQAGLLRVDGLLPPFFEVEFQGVRYT